MRLLGSLALSWAVVALGAGLTWLLLRSARPDGEPVDIERYETALRILRPVLVVWGAAVVVVALVVAVT